MHETERLFLQLVNDGILRVTSEGKVFRVKEYTGGMHKWYQIDCKAREIKGSLGHNGYVRIFVRINQKGYKIFAHRLVWLVFKSDISEHLSINHKNGVKTDNRLENLELMTSREQTLHMINVLGKKIGNFTKGKYHNISNNILTKEEVINIRKLLKSGIEQKEIARKYNVTRVSVNNIANRKTWRYV